MEVTKTPGSSRSPGVLKSKSEEDLAGDLGIVEVLPIFEVIEIHGIEDGSGVGNTHGLQDGGARGVIMIIAHDCGVVLIDGVVVERSAFLVEDPLLALGVGRLALLDVGEESVALDSKGIESHLVKTGTGSGVVAVELADGIERGFLPKAREVKDTERTGDSGSDERNDLAHVLG